MTDSTALAATDAAGLDRLQRRPVIDSVDARTLTLIKAQVAKDCTDAEVGYFLELAAHYDLDPFAHEIWCAKDKKSGRVLIMVGRDGLRKIGRRQGFRIDGDVVREKDDFRVGYDEQTGERRVLHLYEGFAERGAIVGAWCHVTTIDGRSHGYFFAPLSEYKPSGVSEYSPWSKQTSVMILAAAERQALRQATPLSGLLAEGEDESAAALSTGRGNGEGPGWGDMDEALVADVQEVIDRAERVGHAGLANVATAQMRVVGQPDDDVREWIAWATGELDAMAPSEAEVEAAVDIDRDALETRRAELVDLIADGEQEDAPAATLEALRAELASVEERLGPDEQIPGQEGLPL